MKNYCYFTKVIFKTAWLPYIGKVSFSLGEKTKCIYDFLYKDKNLKILTNVLNSPHLGIIHDILNIPAYKRHDYLSVQWFLSYLFLSFQEELQRRKISTRIVPGYEKLEKIDFFQLYFLIYNLGHLPYSFPVEEAIFALNKELYSDKLKELLKTYFSERPPEVIQSTVEAILESCEKSNRNIFYVNSLFIANILKDKLNCSIEEFFYRYIKIVLAQILNRAIGKKQNSLDIFFKEEINRECWVNFSKLFSEYRLLKRIRDLSMVLLDSQFAYSKFIFNIDYAACILNFIEDDQDIKEMLKVLNAQLYQHPAVLYWDNKLKEEFFRNKRLFNFQSIDSIFLEKKNIENIYKQIENIQTKIKDQPLKIFPKSSIKYIRVKRDKRLKSDFIKLVVINETEDIKNQNVFKKIKEVIKKCSELEEKSYKFIAEWLLWAISTLLKEIGFTIETNLNTTCFVIIDKNTVKLISLGRKLVEYNYSFQHAELDKLESLIRKCNIKRGFFFYSLDVVYISKDQQRKELDYLFVFLLPNKDDDLRLFLGEDKDLHRKEKEHLVNFLEEVRRIFGDYLLKEHLIDNLKCP